jgi:integrase
VAFDHPHRRAHDLRQLKDGDVGGGRVGGERRAQVVDAGGLRDVRGTDWRIPLASTEVASRSRRQVPLSRRAVAALDRLPARLDPPLMFSASKVGCSISTRSRARTAADANQGEA